MPIRPTTTAAQSRGASYIVTFPEADALQLTPAQEWIPITNPELNKCIVDPIIEKHGSVLQMIYSLSQSNTLMIAGGSVMANVGALGVAQLIHRDLDIFITRMSEEELAVFTQRVREVLPNAQIVTQNSRGDPYGRRYTTIDVNGTRYEITEVHDDFLLYAQGLINGQIVIEYHPEMPKLLGSYSHIETAMEEGFTLPFAAENMEDSEWIYSCLRYLCEVCMHGGIIPDRLVLEYIRSKFDEFDITQVSEAEVDVLEGAFVPKLREAFERINASTEKDTLLFIACLGYTHMIRKILPVTWSIAHTSSPTPYQLMSRPGVTFAEFQHSLSQGKFQDVNQRILGLAGISSEQLQDPDFCFSPKTNRAVMIAANHFYEEGDWELGESVDIHDLQRSGLRQGALRLMSLSRKRGEKWKFGRLVRDMRAAKEEFDAWRAIHIWMTKPEIQTHFPDHDAFMISHAEQLHIAELLRGIASGIAVISHSIIDIYFDHFFGDVTHPLIRKILRHRYMMFFLSTIGFKQRVIPTPNSDLELLHDLDKLAIVNTLDIAQVFLRTRFLGFTPRQLAASDGIWFEKNRDSLPFMILLERVPEN